MIINLNNIKGRQTLLLCGLFLYPMKSIRSIFFHLFAIITLLVLAEQAFSQSPDSLHVLINKMQRGENDSIRNSAGEEYKNRFIDSLNVSGSFEKSFSEFKNISVITSEDKNFRIYTWTYPNYQGDHYTYFGFAQYRANKDDSLKIVALSDSTDYIIKPESEKLKADRWFGAVYYAIHQIKYDGQTYYILLGWKGFSQVTTKKVIEAAFFDKENFRFGAPLFKTGSVYKNRMVYSFTAQASMSLRFDKNGKTIVLDHLSTPRNKNTSDIISITGPDGTYDSFLLKKGRYVLNKDVDARSEEAPSE